MRTFTDNELLTRVEGLPTFQDWEVGLYDIWVRSKDDIPDKFDDKGFTYWCGTNGQRPIFETMRMGTTNAGLYYLHHPMQPTGTALLKADVIVYQSHKYGLHHGKDAYVQVKSFPYHRDNDRDNKSEELGPVRNGLIGANIHRAGINSTTIYNWSAACIVTAQLSKFQAFLLVAKEHKKPPVSLCILKEWP